MVFSKILVEFENRILFKLDYSLKYVKFNVSQAVLLTLTSVKSHLKVNVLHTTYYHAYILVLTINRY